jgi:hypothetical protein
MQLASLVTQTSQAVAQGSSIRAQLDKVSVQAAETKNAVAEFQKKLAALIGAPGGFFAPPSQELTLSRLNGEAGTLYAQMWQADAEPTASQREALVTVVHGSSDVLKRWAEFTKTDLPALNRLLHDAQVPEVRVEADFHQEESSVDEE